MTAEPSLVSVVIPTFNRADAVTRSIASADAQTYPNLEIIVVDDDSADDTVARIEAMGTTRLLRVIRLAENRGGSAARNAGIAAANGEFVAFLDSDDAWEPAKITRQVAALEAAGPEYGACYTAARFFDASGRLTRVRPATRDGSIRLDLLGLNLVGTTSTVLVARRCLEQAGPFDPAMPSCQDWDLWIRLAAVTRFAALNEPLVRYAVSATGRITNNPRARLTGHLRIYKKYMKAFHRENAAAKGQYCYVLGPILLQAGRRRAARRCLAAAWRADPLSARRAVSLLWALAGFGFASYDRFQERMARVGNRIQRALGQVPS
ncbi:MAG: glycosyltransferase [Alphaproteobacteria bacterium]|nr:glycosyltransferase [Alphaproteobacteria bacterium]